MSPDDRFLFEPEANLESAGLYTQFEVCPYCIVKGVDKHCKVVCPTCGLILSNCNGDDEEC